MFFRVSNTNIILLTLLSSSSTLATVASSGGFQSHNRPPRHNLLHKRNKKGARQGQEEGGGALSFLEDNLADGGGEVVGENLAPTPIGRANEGRGEGGDFSNFGANGELAGNKR